jgi:protein involved in polysaccharide export with SLBB domain
VSTRSAAGSRTACSSSGTCAAAAACRTAPACALTDLVGSLDELQALADTHYVLIRRESGPNRTVSVVSADLAAAFANPASDANILLQARDTVYVFDLARSRERVTIPIIAELERQSSDTQPQQIVTVAGRVKIAGEYPLEPGMTVSDLLRAAGGLDQAAYPKEAELTRYHIANGARRESLQVNINLEELAAGIATADVPLQPFDHLVIKEMPEWSEQESMAILGEVRFPGEYPIRRGETLRSVIQRAGGLTDLAFKEGSVFTREDLKEREQRQMEVLAERLQRDLAALSLQQAQSGEAGAAQAISAGQQLLADLKSTEARRQAGHQPRPVTRLAAGLAGRPPGARRRPALHPAAVAGSDRDRRGAELDLAPLPPGPYARRLHQDERRRHAAGGLPPDLHHPRRRQRRGRRRRPLVQPRGAEGHPAGRHDRRPESTPSA